MYIFAICFPKLFNGRPLVRVAPIHSYVDPNFDGSKKKVDWVFFVLQQYPGFLDLTAMSRPANEITNSSAKNTATWCSQSEFSKCPVNGSQHLHGALSPPRTSILHPCCTGVSEIHFTDTGIQDFLEAKRINYWRKVNIGTPEKPGPIVRKSG